MNQRKQHKYPRCSGGGHALLRWTLGAAVLAGAAHSGATVVSPEYFGMHIHRADSITAWPKVKFGSWRLWDAYVQWTHLEPARGKWDFTRLDRYVELAETNNVSVLLPLGLSPQWASARPRERSSYGPGRAAEPASIDDWRDYVRMVGQRYKGKIKTYEIWNEPNSKEFFSGTPTKLIELTCEASRILKAIDPAIVVVSPAYTGKQNIGQLETFLAAGGDKCIDVVAYHLYTPVSPPEAIPPLVEAIRQVMKRQGVDHLPLWNTESGWFIENADGTPKGRVPDAWLRVSAVQSADYVARAYLLASAFGVDRFYWYAWNNVSMGLEEPEAKTLKPGALAMSVVAEWMTGRPRPSCSETGGMWRCTLSARADERRVVVWSPATPGRYAPPTGWRIKQIERADGRAESPDSIAGTRTDGLPRQFVLSPR